jgi:hypothetical protein
MASPRRERNVNKLFTHGENWLCVDSLHVWVLCCISKIAGVDLIRAGKGSSCVFITDFCPFHSLCRPFAFVACPLAFPLVIV